MKLIVEWSDDIKPITEGEGEKKSDYIVGVFAQAELKNRNGRIYPKKTLEKSINEYINEYVKNRRALGELNHPSSPSVNPDRACILVESLEWDGNNCMGKAKITSTPCGDIVRGLIRDGAQLGVSTRGIGSVKTDPRSGITLVESDYTVRAIDVVTNPSGIDCFVDGIMESVEFYIENGVYKAREVERIQESIKRNDKKALIEDMNNFSKKISQCLKG